MGRAYIQFINFIFSNRDHTNDGVFASNVARLLFKDILNMFNGSAFCQHEIKLFLCESIVSSTPTIAGVQKLTHCDDTVIFKWFN